MSMSIAVYEKKLQAQLCDWGSRIDKLMARFLLRSTAARKTVIGAHLFRSQRYPPRAGGREIPFRIGIQFVAYFAVLIFLNLPAIAFAQSSCPGIHVKIPNLKNSNGNVACGLFESPDGFPTKFLRSATGVIIKKIQKTEAKCNFADIPPGTYAIAVIHDENMNSELDTSWMGLPSEGFGFSKTTLDEFGAPAFSAASFRYDGRNLDLTINLKY